MKRAINKEVKVVWLSRMFYGVSNATDLHINPYEDLSEFLNAQIGSLSWGSDKEHVKERFSQKYHLLLDLYGIKLSIKYIREELDQEGQLNKLAVEHWAEHSEFPANW